MKIIDPNNISPETVFDLAEKLNHKINTNGHYYEITQKFLGKNYVNKYSNGLKITLIKRLSRQNLNEYYKELLNIYLKYSK